MNRIQSLFRMVVLAAVAAVSAGSQAPYPPPVQAFSGMVHQPPQQSSFTLDRSMLAAADGLLNGVGPEGRRIAAGLNSITFANFRYRDFATYDPSAFASLNAAYEASGFHHMVNANGHNSLTTTDLWLRTQGAMVTNVVVLTRGDRNMNAISVDCNLRPLDLLHLSGHFGIPQVDANVVMVPATPGGAAPNVATGPITQARPAPAAPLQNPPVLRHHGADDPQ